MTCSTIVRYSLSLPDQWGNAVVSGPFCLVKKTEFVLKARGVVQTGLLHSVLETSTKQGIRMPGAKTKKMIQVERKLRRPLERALPEMLNEVGLTGAAKRLGVSKATLSYWLLKLGIEIRRVALAPGEEIEIRRMSG